MKPTNQGRWPQGGAALEALSGLSKDELKTKLGLGDLSEGTGNRTHLVDLQAGGVRSTDLSGRAAGVNTPCFTCNCPQPLLCCLVVSFWTYFPILFIWDQDDDYDDDDDEEDDEDDDDDEDDEDEDDVDDEDDEDDHDHDDDADGDGDDDDDADADGDDDDDDDVDGDGDGDGHHHHHHHHHHPTTTTIIIIIMMIIIIITTTTTIIIIIITIITIITIIPIDSYSPLTDMLHFCGSSTTKQVGLLANIRILVAYILIISRAFTWLRPICMNMFQLQVYHVPFLSTHHFVGYIGIMVCFYLHRIPTIYSKFIGLVWREIFRDPSFLMGKPGLSFSIFP